MGLLQLVGAGGHGRVVRDALHAQGCDDRDIDLRDATAGTTPDGAAISAPELADRAGDAAHIAIGDGAARRRLTARARQLGLSLRPVVHPKAYISSSAKVADGAFVASHAVVATGARVGVGAIVNHHATVDHDCAVGDYAHIAPGAVLGGGSRVGEGALVGAAAVVLPGVAIGKDAVIGAGSVVLGDVPPGRCYAGNPARDIGGGR